MSWSGESTALRQLPRRPYCLAKSSDETDEHATDFHHLALSGFKVCASNEIGVGRELEMVFELRRGGDGDLEESREIRIGGSTAPFGDIGRNSRRGIVAVKR